MTLGLAMKGSAVTCQEWEQDWCPTVIPFHVQPGQSVT